MTLALDTFRARLEQMRADTQRTLSMTEGTAQTVALDQNRVGRLSRMDAMQGQAMAKANSERQQQRLRQISRALSRIDCGDYGRCLDCEDWITEGRLDIDPTIEYCMGCAALRERI
jgi:DnaK suppressor protein